MNASNNIVDFLVTDHRRIKQLLEETVNTVSITEKRKKFRELIRQFYLHEEIEEEVFRAIERLPGDERLRDLASDNENLHDALWHLLELTSDALDSENSGTVNRAFEDLDSVIRTHMASEEEILFPHILSAVPREVLLQLELYAQKQSARMEKPEAMFQSSRS